MGRSPSEDHCSIFGFFFFDRICILHSSPSHFCTPFLCTYHSLHTVRTSCLCFPLSVSIAAVISSLGCYAHSLIQGHSSLERRSYLGREPVHILIIIDMHWDVIHLCNPDKPVTLYEPVHTKTTQNHH